MKSTAAYGEAVLLSSRAGNYETLRVSYLPDKAARDSFSFIRRAGIIIKLPRVFRREEEL
jgi:hypothetical protein